MRKRGVLLAWFAPWLLPRLDPSGATSARPASPGLARALPGIFLLFASSRLLLLAIAYLTIEHIHPVVPFTWDIALFQMLCRWDCGWYVQIIEHGYSAASAPDQPGVTSLAFFPVFPLLAKALHLSTGLSAHDSALIVANLCFFAALCYIHQYVLALAMRPRVAMLSVALLCFAPQSFSFSTAYTESTFLLLLAAALYHFRHEHILRASVAAALLSATRAVGIFFVFFALFYLASRFGRSLPQRLWQRPQLALPIVLAPLGLVAFWFYCYWLTGDAFAQASSAGHGWNWWWAPFHQNLADHLTREPVTRFWALSSLLLFACSLLLLRVRLWAEFGFCLFVFLLLWSSQTANALLRYGIVLFPIWIGLAHWLARRPTAAMAGLGCMALLNGFLMVNWTLGKLIAI